MVFSIFIHKPRKLCTWLVVIFVFVCKFNIFIFVIDRMISVFIHVIRVCVCLPRPKNGHSHIESFALQSKYRMMAKMLVSVYNISQKCGRRLLIRFTLNRRMLIFVFRARDTMQNRFVDTHFSVHTKRCRREHKNHPINASVKRNTNTILFLVFFSFVSLFLIHIAHINCLVLFFCLCLAIWNRMECNLSKCSFESNSTKKMLLNVMRRLLFWVRCAWFHPQNISISLSLFVSFRKCLKWSEKNCSNSKN